MKKLAIFILLLGTLASCKALPIRTHVEIEWVDFIKWNGKEYNGIYTAELADEKSIGGKIGEVKFKVADNIFDTHYKIKNGDAAFHEKGTEIYEIKGYPDYIAVKSPDKINGYAVYYDIDESEYNWYFKQVPLTKVSRIEIYQLMVSNENKKVSELKTNKEVERFLQLLKNSRENPNFEPNMEKGDPTYYDILLYTDGPIAYKYDLQFDGFTYFWHPWDTNILSNDINKFIPSKP